MKKIAFITFLIFLFQEPAESVELKDTFAVAGGITSFNRLQSDASGAVDTDTTQSVGIYSGVFGEVSLVSGGGLVLSPGVFLSQKGAETTEAKIRTSYLETSAQLKWFFVNGTDFRMYFGAGLGFGILLSAEESQTSGSVTDTFSQFAKNELSGQGGLGLEFVLSNATALQLGGSYVRGLTSHLNAENSGGSSGNWEGFYGFAALRFKAETEDNSAEKRARDYIRYKVQNFRDWDRRKKPIKEESLTEETLELAPQKNLEGSLFEDFTELAREPASQTRAPKRLIPKRRVLEPLPQSKKSDSWEEENIDSWDNDEPESW